MSVAFPGESARYREARDRLLDSEVALRRATEAVAQARRDLPPGGEIPQDYLFQGTGADGTPAGVRMSQLFAPGKDSLVIYSMMFPRAPGEDLPCPSCTQFLDSFDGAAGHAAQRINLAVVTKAALPRLQEHARRRGWHRLQLLSSGGTSYNRDYLAEDEDGAQLPMTNVFRRDGGTIRHFWGSELLYTPAEPGQDPRHGDTLEPLWNLFDLTPDGRGTDWYPDFSY
jgi:predicted dithiol-disulfide oxidoreductase (DUF899 family)